MQGLKTALAYAGAVGPAQVPLRPPREASRFRGADPHATTITLPCVIYDPNDIGDNFALGSKRPEGFGNLSAQGHDIFDN
jgi:hypothetical protein